MPENEIVLSKFERLLLSNQFRIMERLYPEEDYAESYKALEAGYELHYDWVFESIYDGLTRKECKEVL